MVKHFQISPIYVHGIARSGDVGVVMAIDQGHQHAAAAAATHHRSRRARTFTPSLAEGQAHKGHLLHFRVRAIRIHQLDWSKIQIYKMFKFDIGTSYRTTIINTKRNSLKLLPTLLTRRYDKNNKFLL